MPPGGLYVLFITLLLLVALGLAVPVLRGIVIEGIERQRSGEGRHTPDATETPPADSDRPRAVCSNCETRNDDDFVYCRECGTRL